MKTIIFLNNKGGVGKTASVSTIAHMLATEHHKRTLLIDLDPQMNTTSMYSEIDFVKLFYNIYKGTCEKIEKSGILISMNVSAIRHTKTWILYQVILLFLRQKN